MLPQERVGEKKELMHDQRVRDIEHGSFSPQVFSTTGSMGTTATVVYRRLASMTSEKYGKPYNKSMQWIICNLNYSFCLHVIVPAWISIFTTLSPYQWIEALLTLPVQWAGSQIRTEQVP